MAAPSVKLVLPAAKRSDPPAVALRPKSGGLSERQLAWLRRNVASFAAAQDAVLDSDRRAARIRAALVAKS